MPGTYRPELLAAIAQGAAEKVQGRVIRWLRDVGDGRFFHVEAEVVLLGGGRLPCGYRWCCPNGNPLLSVPLTNPARDQQARKLFASHRLVRGSLTPGSVGVVQWEEKNFVDRWLVGGMMAQNPTSEQYGRRILKVCKDNYLRAGEQILPQLLRLSLLDTHELPPEALIAGLHWLIDQGYLEERGPLQTGYVLTPKGFAAF